jgi:transcriptional regulator with XRE-family HTH domain
MAVIRTGRKDLQMDDRRVGLIVRALRRRRGWRQSDLAAASDVSQQTVSVVERGHLDTLSIRTSRRILSALDARGEFEVRWRGGSLDRTMDENHAWLVGAVVESLRSHDWDSAVEVTYAVYGERGSIDVLGFHRRTGSLLVIEVKTEITSVEETLRKLDEKVRLADRIARARLGWAATTTSRILVLPATPAARRGVARHEQVFDLAMPARTVAIRQWLNAPVGSISGQWFLANTTPRGTRSGPQGRERVRGPSSARNRGGSRTTPGVLRPKGGPAPSNQTRLQTEYHGGE